MHLVWCGHPAGRLEVELTKLLQLAVLLGHQLDTHGLCRIQRAALSACSPCVGKRFSVEQGASPTRRTFGRTIAKDVLVSRLVVWRSRRFAAGTLHFGGTCSALGSWRGAPELHPTSPLWRAGLFANRAFRLVSKAACSRVFMESQS